MDNKNQMKYKIGDVVFFNNPNSWFGKLITTYNIRKYGFSNATHVGIISNVNKDSVIIHEAYSKGFVTNVYTNEQLKWGLDNDRVHIKRSKIKLFDVPYNADKYLGRGYSYFDIVRIGFTFIIGFHIFNFGCSKHLICSEAVSRILYDSSNKKLNLSAEFKKPYDLITPMDIFISREFNGKK